MNTLKENHYLYDAYVRQMQLNSTFATKAKELKKLESNDTKNSNKTISEIQTYINMVLEKKSIFAVFKKKTKKLKDYPTDFLEQKAQELYGQQILHKQMLINIENVLRQLETAMTNTMYIFNKLDEGERLSIKNSYQALLHHQESIKKNYDHRQSVLTGVMNIKQIIQKLNQPLTRSQELDDLLDQIKLLMK